MPEGRLSVFSRWPPALRLQLPDMAKGHRTLPGERPQLVPPLSSVYLETKEAAAITTATNHFQMLP